MPKQARPTRGAAAEQRRKAFSHAFLRLGTAAAAFREVTPAARRWTAQSIATEASRYMRRPEVQAEIAGLQADARLDAIASRSEIARYLVSIMRGEETETRIIKTKDPTTGMIVELETQIPPPVSQRIRAARELERMLPSVLPPDPADAADNAKDDISSTLADRLAQIRIAP